MLSRKPRIQRFWRHWTACALLAISLAAAGSLAGQARHKTHTQPKTDPKPAVNALPPFRVGEQLDYRVSWATFTTAATIRLAVAERRELRGWDTFHLRATARTENAARILYTVDDQFDSYSDTGTLASHQYEMYIREQGKQVDDVIRLLPQGTAVGGSESSVIVLPGTRDPVGVIYFLREVDWQRTPTTAAPVYDGKKFYDLHAQLASAHETVTVPAGSFSASRITVQVFEYRQQTPAASFSIWLAQDAAHTPVLMQADLPFGSVRAELTGAAK